MTSLSESKSLPPKQFTEFTRGNDKTYELNTLFSKLKLLQGKSKLDKHNIYKHFKILQNNELSIILSDELIRIYKMISNNPQFLSN